MKRRHNILSISEQPILKDLLSPANDVVQKKKKALSYLRFAKPTRNGWSFFKKKRAQCELLEDITQRVNSMYPYYEKGRIAHLLSELVNLSKRDLLHLQTLLSA